MRASQALFLGCSVLMSVAGAHAYDSSGTQAMETLLFAPGARSGALAGSLIAANAEDEAMFYNPAGMLGLINPKISFSHTLLWQGISYDALWGIQPLGRLGSLGVSLVYLNVPDFNSTANPLLGSEGAFDFIAGASYAVPIKNNIRAGVTLRYLHSQLGSAVAKGYSANLGGQLLLHNDQLILGMALLHLGQLEAYISKADPLPTQISAGISYLLWPDEVVSLLSSMNLEYPIFESRLTFTAGLECRLWHNYFIRAGVDGNVLDGSWLNLGGGIRWRSLELDYALTPAELLGAVHRFTLSYHFGDQHHLPRPKITVNKVVKEDNSSEGKPLYVIHFIPEVQTPAGLARWDLVISKRQGEVIKQISGSKKLPLKVAWDGRDYQGNPVDPEGYYAYQFSIADNQGYQAKDQGEILPISITRLPQLRAIPREIYLGKASFEPKDKEKIKAWSVKILNSDSAVIQQFEGLGMLPKNLDWNGLSSAGAPIALRSGFTYLSSMEDFKGNIVVSRMPVVLVKTGTKAYTTQPVAIKDQVVFKFEYPRQFAIRAWTLDITDENQQPIRHFENLDQLPEELVWDACTDRNEVVLANRRFGYVLRIQDSLGNIWQQADAIRSTPVNYLGPTPEGGRNRVQIEQILFDFDSAILKPDMSDKLNKAADLALAHDANNTYFIVDGHTDEIGSERYNLSLSKQRSDMVMRFLVEELLIPSQMINTYGYGKARPLTKGLDPETRTRNRRVEIMLNLPK